MIYLLVSDTKYRKAFDIANILSLEFPQHHIMLGVESVSFFRKMKYRLTYGNKELVLLRSSKKELFEQDLDKLCKDYKNDCTIYIPVEEETTNYFCDYIESRSQTVFKYLLPKNDLYTLFRNKASLNEYCLENGFEAPQKYLIPDFPNNAYPIILKPIIGSGSAGIIRLDKKNDYTEEIRNTITKEPYLAQEMIPNGKDVLGAFYLCKEGEVIGAYTHKRIRTMPAEGGVTVCSKIGDNELLLEQGRKLLQHAKWNGLVMLEFLYDPKTNTYKTIEANPRLWGSIMLSEFAGANLLKNYVNICLDNDLSSVNINKNCYIRWPIIDIVGYLKSGLRIKRFWNKKDTCFINWTYSRMDRAILFLFFSVFSISNFKKILKRL